MAAQFLPSIPTLAWWRTGMFPLHCSGSPTIWLLKPTYLCTIYFGGICLFLRVYVKGTGRDSIQ